MPFDGHMPVEPSAPEREPGCVRAVILYNPLDPNDRDIADIEWREGKTVAEYLEGLPEGVTWTVAAAGRVLEREEWDQVALVEDDTIVLAVTPEGKGGSGWMIAAALVLAVVSAGVGTAIAGSAAVVGALGTTGASIAGAVAGAAISIGGSLLMNAIFPASAAKTDNGGDETSSPSYSIDGPQSTARENVPLPVVYGEFRAGGNRINVFTQNADEKTQDVYLQYALSDGEIENVWGLEINDQPAENFRDIAFDWRPGTLGQPQLSWFIDTPVPYSDGRTLSPTAVIYNTVDEVDRVQIDVAWPQGLFNIDDKKGDRYLRSSSLYATLEPIGGGTPILLQSSRWHPTPWTGNTVEQPGTAIRVTVAVHGASGVNPSTPYSARCIINQNSDSGFFQVLDQTKAGRVANSYVADNNWAAGTELLTFEFNNADLSQVIERDFQIYVTGGFITNVETLRRIPHIVTRNERNPFQITFDSGPLTRGRYQLRVWRGEEENTSDKASDKMVLAQVREIQADPVRYNRTAYYALKIRLNDQLNSIPKTTVMVRGRKVNEYDVNGNVVIRQWSNNPADIALDILLSKDGYRRMSKSRIDFSWFRRWRSFCIVNNLTFNGIFDYQTNTWDALVQVMRAGRATPIVSGLKWSGVMEAPDEAVMMFGSQNIIKGSFRNNWLGRAGRANMVEGQYYDKNDGYKQRSVYATDEAALAAGNDLIQATINLIGVTDPAQAQKEVDLQLQINRLIVQGCSFAAMTDAIGCRVGDVIYVQHDMPRWGWTDRAVAIAGNVINLHNALESQGAVAGSPLPDGDWRVLLLKPAVQRDSAEISSISGSQVTVNKAIGAGVRITRLMIAGQDYQVLDRANFASSTVFVLDRTPPVGNGTAVQLWDTDVLAEGKIARPTVGATSITLTEWTHGFSIAAGDQLMIGRVGRFKKPFRVVKFGYDSEQTRTIECLEYIPEIYEPLGTNPDTNYSELQPFPLHVESLSADQVTEDVGGGGVRYFAEAKWIAPLNDQRGHDGSRVFVSVNDGDFFLHETVHFGRFSSRYEARVNDTIRFKVVAFDRAGLSAPEPYAPIAVVTIGRRLRAPLPPTGLSAVGSVRLISLAWARPDDADIKLYEVFENSVNDISTAYKVGETATAGFVRTGLMPRVTRWYWVRSLSYAGEYSVTWAGPAQATTDWLVAADIADGILDTSKFAASINPIGIPATAAELNNFKSTDNIIFPQVSLTDTGGQVLQPQRLYRWNGTQWVSVISAPEISGQLTNDQIADLNANKLSGNLAAALFPNNLRPVEVVNSLPTTGNFAGRTVMLTTDGKIYRHLGSPTGSGGFTAAVPAADLSGQITSTQITDNAVSAAKIAANAVTAGKIAANAVTAGTIAANAVTAGTVQAGAITSDKIQAGAIGASKITIGDTQNTYPDFDMKDPGFYSSPINSPYTFVANNFAQTGANILQITDSAVDATAVSNWFTVDVNADYAVSGSAWTLGTAPELTATLEIEFGTLGTSGLITPTRREQVGQRTNVTNATRFTIDVKTASNERRARFVMSKNAVSGGSGRFGGFILCRRYTGSLIVDGAISAAKIAAGAVTTEKLSVGSASGNVIYNSCMAYNRSGWSVSGSILPTAWGAVGVDFENSLWRLTGGGSGGFMRIGTITGNNYIDLCWTHYNDARVPVAAGEWWEFQARVQAHRCRVNLIVCFYDSSGAYINESILDWSTTRSANGLTLDSYDLAWGKVQAPANAATALPLFRMTGTSGFGTSTGVNPYVFFTRALFARCMPNQTEPSPWGPGGITEIEGGMIKAASIQADNIAANAITSDKIAANSIVAGKIAAGAISSTEIAAGQVRAVNLASETLITQAGQLGSAVITEAKIGDLEVGTIKIKNNAVSATSAAWGDAGAYNPITNNWDARADVVHGDSNYPAIYLVEAVFYGQAYIETVSTGEGSSFQLYPIPIAIWRNGSLITTHNISVQNRNSYVVKLAEYLGPGFYTWTASPSWSFGGHQGVTSVSLIVTKLLK